MTNKDLIAVVAREHGLTQADARAILKTFIGVMRGVIQAEGRLHLADLGVFTLRERKARVLALPTGPRGESGRKVAAYKTIHFQPAANFKRAVNLK